MAANRNGTVAVDGATADEIAGFERVSDRDLSRLRRAEAQVTHAQEQLATAQQNLARAVENDALWRGARDYAALEIREFYNLSERDTVDDDGTIRRNSVVPAGA